MEAFVRNRRQDVADGASHRNIRGRSPEWQNLNVLKARIRYVELKTANGDGPAWIGRVQLSKTGRTVYYRNKTLRRIPGGGISGNHVDVETGEEYWVSGVKKNQEDRHWAGHGPVIVDEDVKEEYEALLRR